MTVLRTALLSFSNLQICLATEHFFLKCKTVIIQDCDFFNSFFQSTEQPVYLATELFLKKKKKKKGL